MKITFERTIKPSETAGGYLNLSSDPLPGRTNGIGFGRKIGLPGRADEEVVVVHETGATTPGAFHGRNQFWADSAARKSWYPDNGIAEGSRVRIDFDPDERREGLAVLRVTLLTDSRSTR